MAGFHFGTGFWKKGQDAALPFIFTVTVGSGQSFQLPTVITGTYDCIIDWGDSTSNALTVWNAAGRSHTYTTGGTYEIKISGVFNGWAVNNYADRLKITEMKQWGGLLLGTGANGFNGCSNITFSATDMPDISACTSFEALFYGCSSVTSIPNLNDWDVGHITAFGGTTASLAGCFGLCTNFNQDISAWDVSSAITMSGMFRGCTNFNQNLNSWDVSSVQRFFRMFNLCTSLNQSFSDWDVSTAFDFRDMFAGCSNFNGNVTTWVTSAATAMNGMFAGCTAFNQNIGAWDVSSVQTFGSSLSDGMFVNCTNFNQNLNSWDVSSAQRVDYMFYNATSYNQPMNGWVTTSLVGMAGVFMQASAFNQDLDQWDVSGVSDMRNVFRSATNFNGDISTWDVSNVVTFSLGIVASGIFAGASNIDQDLSSWVIESATDIRFGTGIEFSTANYDAMLIAWAAQSVQSNVEFFIGSSKYTSGGAAEAARTTLITTYGWTINDGGPA